MSQHHAGFLSDCRKNCLTFYRFYLKVLMAHAYLKSGEIYRTSP